MGFSTYSISMSNSLSDRTLYSLHHLQALYSKSTVLTSLAFGSAICSAPALAGNGAPHPAGLIQNLEIVSDSPAFNGNIPQGGKTAYRVVKGIVHGELDPNAAENSNIVYLKNAPVNKEGYVEYKTDVVLLVPQNMQHAKRALIYEVANRGGKLGKYTFIGGGELGKGEAPNGTFPSWLEQGYTIVWSGWQGDLPLNGHSSLDPSAPLGTDFPIARHSDGSAITGMSREEYIPDMVGKKTIKLSYPPANPKDTERAKLTARQSWQTEYGRNNHSAQSYQAPSVEVSQWHYVTNKDGSYSVDFKRPETVPGPNGKKVSPDQGTIYSFEYRAKDPQVNGVGFAAVRDLITFLREQKSDAKGNANPLNELKQAQCVSDHCDKSQNFDIAIGEGISQSGRYLRGFLYQGFNRSLDGKKVFEGLMPIVPGGRRIWLNYAFSQPGRWSRAHEDHFMRGFDFPFAYNVFTDPVSGKTDGILKQCQATHTCPKVIQLDGSFEWWGAGASLVTTDGDGKDLVLPENVRYYMVAGAQHTGSVGVTTGFPPFSSWNKTCALPDSSIDQNTVDRALMHSMIAWVAKGISPPPSSYPLIDKGTAVLPSQLAMPDLSQLTVYQPDSKKTVSLKVPYSGELNRVYLTDYEGAIPHIHTDKAYQLRVPAVDKNGNETSGILTPEVAVPLATYMGWNYRKAGHALGEACDWFGSSVPLAANDNIKNPHDSRASLATLYEGRRDYQHQVAKSANQLVQQGYLLPKDASDFYLHNAMQVSKLLIPNP
ncbi:peptidase [Vibrio sp. CAIM 722]|uniref:Peptidase n=1 Tax=Vibrio eleionomae TaxID=2653505 RepID=A0A7X4LNX8_9VIBR|nr:alpha/beta hydrolase domain-containing protein [Vibrio eleionomae]MZI95432.1 peptidase [Vibrio eleionomae]